MDNGWNGRLKEGQVHQTWEMMGGGEVGDWRTRMILRSRQRVERIMEERYIYIRKHWVGEGPEYSFKIYFAGVTHWSISRPTKQGELWVVLWSTQRLLTFMSTQRISRHVDITFNISTKEQWKIECQSCEKLQWVMQLLLNKRMKHHWVQNAAYYNKLRALLRRVFPNYISFTTSLISASRKTCTFYVNEISIGPCMCYTRRVSVITVTGLPFIQMEPFLSMETRSGNPVRRVLSVIFAPFQKRTSFLHVKP